MTMIASKSRTSKMKTVLGVTAALVCGVLTPTLASAQAYGSQSYGGAYDRQGYYYDPCQRSTTRSGVARVCSASCSSSRSTSSALNGEASWP